MLSVIRLTVSLLTEAPCTSIRCTEISPVVSPFREQADHQLVQIGQPALPLTDDLRGETAVAVPPYTTSVEVNVRGRLPLRCVAPSTPATVRTGPRR